MMWHTNTGCAGSAGEYLQLRVTQDVKRSRVVRTRLQRSCLNEQSLKKCVLANALHVHCKSNHALHVHNQKAWSIQSVPGFCFLPSPITLRLLSRKPINSLLVYITLYGKKFPGHPPTYAGKIYTNRTSPKMIVWSCTDQAARNDIIIQLQYIRNTVNLL